MKTAHLLHSLLLPRETRACLRGKSPDWLNTAAANFRHCSLVPFVVAAIIKHNPSFPLRRQHDVGLWIDLVVVLFSFDLAIEMEGLNRMDILGESLFDQGGLLRGTSRLFSQGKQLPHQGQ